MAPLNLQVHELRRRRGFRYASPVRVFVRPTSYHLVTAWTATQEEEKSYAENV